MNKSPIARAVHIADGDSHIVGFKSLRVMLSQDGSYWVAQGLDLDYVSYGNDEESAKKNFTDGLKATVFAHLQQNGGIESLLKPAADPQVWGEYYKLDTKSGDKKLRLSCIQLHQPDEADVSNLLPFDVAAFLSRVSTADSSMATA